MAYSSPFSPRATIRELSGRGRCSVAASAHGARSQAPISSAVRNMTGIALVGWTRATSALGSIVRKP